MRPSYFTIFLAGLFLMGCETKTPYSSLDGFWQILTKLDKNPSIAGERKKISSFKSTIDPVLKDDGTFETNTTLALIPLDLGERGALLTENYALNTPLDLSVSGIPHRCHRIEVSTSYSDLGPIVLSNLAGGTVWESQTTQNPIPSPMAQPPKQITIVRDLAAVCFALDEGVSTGITSKVILGRVEYFIGASSSFYLSMAEVRLIPKFIMMSAEVNSADANLTECLAPFVSPLLPSQKQPVNGEISELLCQINYRNWNGFDRQSTFIFPALDPDTTKSDGVLRVNTLEHWR